MDFPSGPLDIYRQKASFSWKEMLNFMEGEDIQAFKVPSSKFSCYHGSPEVFYSFHVPQRHIFRTLENDPLFARRPGEDLPLDRMRELTFLRYERWRMSVQVLCVCVENQGRAAPAQGEEALLL